MGIDYIYCKYCNDCRIDEVASPCHLCFFDKNDICREHEFNNFSKYKDLLCKECKNKDYNKIDAIKNFERDYYVSDNKKYEEYLKRINIIDMISNNENIKKLNNDIKKLNDRIKKREVKQNKLIQSIKLI